MAMRSAVACVRVVAISLAVRYKSSPRGLAAKLALCGQRAFEGLVNDYRNGVAYEQTGNSKEDISIGIFRVAEVVVDRSPYTSWESLENVIAIEMKRHCNGNAVEWFSARQVAADLCRLPGFVKGLGAGQRPKMCWLGPGARKGWYFAERAKKLLNTKYQPVKIPQRCEFRRQTGYCEYMKLVKRLNFYRLLRRVRYQQTL